MKRRILRLTNLFIPLLFISAFLKAQDKGTIRGYVKDADTKESIIGANILIESLGTGAAGDLDGFFTIGKVPPGTYTLIINSIGYRTKKVENIQVVANNVTELNIFTENESTALQEVVVTSGRVSFTEVAVLSDIKAAQQVVSGISSSQIAKSLDRNAAEVVKRIPGVTIFNERFINIRGLNERYNTVMLNNTFTPSMESDVRSFSFDVIPSNQIDRILVYKSPAAELPGEFAGGVVKIFSKSIPDHNSLTVDLSGSYRNGTTNKDFYAPKSGSGFLPYTGFNDGYSDLPSFFPSTNELKTLAVNNPARLQQVGQSMRNSWTPLQSNALPDMRLGITGTLKTKIGKTEIGNVTAINYSNTNSFFAKTQNDYGYANFEQTRKADEISVFNDKQYSSAIRLGALFNWAAKINASNVIEFKNLYNQLSNGQFINRNGFENGANWHIESFNQNYRGIYTGQLLGKHELNNGLTKFDWVAGYNQSFNQIPDYKRFRYDNAGNLLVPTGAAQTFNLGRTNINLNEKAYTGGVNLTQKVILNKEKSDKELEIKAGAYYELKDRDFNARNLGYVQANSSLFNIGNLPIAQIFAQQNINTTNGVKLDEQTNKSDAYTAKNNLLALYLSGNLPLSRKFNLIAGVRSETNKQTLNGFDNKNGNPVAPVLNKTNLLPSINLTYNFSEKSLLRAAYGQTVNRPEFREIAPFTFYDFVLNRVVTGNENLKNASIQNFDLRYELYPTPSEVVSAALFYKNFSNPIEVVFTSASNPNVSFDNAKSAYSAGVEFEIRKSLEKLTGIPTLDKLNVLFNASFILSKVNLGASNAATQSDNRPLQGQSPYLVNAGLNYNDTKSKLQLNLLYNVIGKRIYAVGNNFGTLYPDWYELPRNLIDLTFSKAITENLTIKGGINDLLNQKVLILQDGNQDKKFDSGKDQVIQSYSPGSVYSLGIVFKIQNNK